MVLSALLTRSERNYSVLAQGLMKRHLSGNPQPDSPKTVNSKSSSPFVAASFATMSLPTGPDCPAEDGIAAARNKAGARDAACGTLFLLLICTGIYSWCEPMVHYFTKLSYILCILLGGNQQTAPKSPRLEERKDALRSHPFSKDIHGGCSPPSPVLRSSHGPSGPPTCSQRKFLPKSFSSRRRTFCWQGREGKQQQWPPLTDGGTAACCPEPLCPYWTWTTRTESSLCFGCASARGAAWPHGALACIFSRQLVQNITSRLSRLTQKSVKSLSSRSANFSSPVALERHVLVSMVL